MSENPKKIDVSAQRVASVYAKALLAATEKAGSTEDVLRQFDDIVTGVLDKHERFEAVLASGLIDSEEKAAIIDRVLAGRVAPILLNFFKVLSRHGRLDLVRAIYREATAALDELRGRVKVEVRSAAPLDPQTAGFIADAMQKKLGFQPRLEVREDPSLIGGILLRVGDTVFDGSIATQLTRVRSAMINRSVHEIQSRRDRVRPAGGN